MEYTLEICCNSVQSALNAQRGGANRVELCDNLWEAGTTPSAGTIQLARDQLSIDLFILIRPRGGDFIYSPLELQIMLEDIRRAKELGVDGIVSGALTADQTVHLEYTKELVAAADPLPFTFHRAFDVLADLYQGLDDIMSSGAHRLLTSGGFNTAHEGLSVIKELHQRVGNQLVIMPGGGINELNITDLKHSGCTEFHLSGSEKIISPSNGHGSVKLNGSPDIPEMDYKESSQKRVAAVRQLLLD